MGITDSNGNLVSSYEYDSFGNFSLTGTDLGNDRLFTGREYDRETGLYYYRARYYDSKLGRFISRDPIDISDNINLYTYVGNNPVMFSDPSGLKAKQVVSSIYDFGTEVSGIKDLGASQGALRAYWVGYYTDDQDLMEVSIKGMQVHGMNIVNPIKKVKAVNKLLKDTGVVKIAEIDKIVEKITNTRYIPKSIKDFVRDKSGNTCVYCGVKTNTDKISNPMKSEIDHRKPYSKSKDSGIDNLQNTCRTCNREKSNKISPKWGNND